MLHFTRTTILITLALSGSAFAIDISPSKAQGGSTNNIPYQNEPGTPSLISNPFRLIFGNPHSEAMKRVQAPPHFKVELSTIPETFTPGTNGTLKVRMTAINKGKDKFILEFPTAQRFDFSITRKDGTEVYRSSQNKVYTQNLSSIVLNRDEKAVYEEDLFTSERPISNLTPGEYKLKGEITAKTPLSVERDFLIQ